MPKLEKSESPCPAKSAYLLLPNQLARIMNLPSLKNPFLCSLGFRKSLIINDAFFAFSRKQRVFQQNLYYVPTRFVFDPLSTPFFGF